MTKKTHIVVALAVTLPLILEVPIAFWGLFSAVAPDLFKKKEITHSVLSLVFTTLFILLIDINIAIVWCINYLLHIFLDSFTKDGVKFLYPSKRIYGVRVIEGKKKDDIFIGNCAMTVIFIILMVGY